MDERLLSHFIVWNSLQSFDLFSITGAFVNTEKTEIHLTNWQIYRIKMTQHSHDNAAGTENSASEQ